MAVDQSGGGPGRVAPRQASHVTRRVTALSVGAASVLCLIKAGAFALSGSVALLASLADSALDLAAALTTYVAVRYAAEPADAEHRFGHGKAEALAALAQAVLVAFAAALVAREAAGRFLVAEPVRAGWAALAVMAVASVLTIALVAAQSRAVRATGSVAVAGDRAHYLSDLAANASVMAGIALSAFGGMAWADPVVGVGVAAWLVWTAWTVARAATDQVMDRELPDADRAQIERLALATPGVRRVHALRTRAAGPLAHVQLHVVLDPDQSLADAHAVVVQAERAIVAAFPGADVIIHPDPDGAEAHGNPHLGGPDEDRHDT